MRRSFSILSILLLIASPLLGAIAFDAAATGSSTDDFSFNYTATGSDLEMVVGTCTSTGGGSSVLGVTANGTSMTSVGNSFQNTIRAQLFHLAAPSTGTHSVAVDVSNPVSAVSAIALIYTGVHQTSPIGTGVTGGGSSSVPSIAVTSATGEMVVDIVCTGDTITMSVGAGQTRRGVVSLAQASAGMSEESGAGTVTMSWTDTLADWAQVGVPLKPTSSSGWWWSLQGAN